MLHPAAHPPQQNAVMVDIHDQVGVLEYKQKGVEDVGGLLLFFFPQIFKIPLLHKLVGNESHVTLNSICLFTEHLNMLNIIGVSSAAVGSEKTKIKSRL